MGRKNNKRQKTTHNISQPTIQLPQGWQAGPARSSHFQWRANIAGLTPHAKKVLTDLGGINPINLHRLCWPLDVSENTYICHSFIFMYVSI